MTVAVISHLHSTAAAQRHVLSSVHSVGLLDIEVTMPARPSVAEAAHHAPLNLLATNGGGK